MNEIRLLTLQKMDLLLRLLLVPGPNLPLILDCDDPSLLFLLQKGCFQDYTKNLITLKKLNLSSTFQHTRVLHMLGCVFFFLQQTTYAIPVSKTEKMFKLEYFAYILPEIR